MITGFGLTSSNPFLSFKQRAGGQVRIYDHFLAPESGILPLKTQKATFRP